MFSTRGLNHKINRLHERGLRAPINDETSRYKETLLHRNHTITRLKNN